MNKEELHTIWKTYSTIPDVGCNGPTEIVLAYDNDNAGLDATDRAFDLIQSMWGKIKCNCYYQHILVLMARRGLIDLKQEDFNQMYEWDLEQDQLIRDEEKYYLEVLKPQITKLNAEWREEEKEFFREKRIEFLTNKIKECESYMERYREGVDNYRRKGYDFLTRFILDQCLWDGGSIDKKEKYIKKLKAELDFRRNDSIIGNGGVTKEEVDRANSYPFTSLLEFNRRGFVKCPFHNEGTASCSLNKKNNTIHCFGCGITKDPIAFVMDQYNKSFIEAVRQLNGNI